MENKNDNWVLRGLLFIALFGWAFVMYAKTAEVFTALAPLTLFGQKGLQSLYGMFVASLIEGVAVILALLPSAHKSRSASVYVFVLFAISLFCQFMDKYLVTEVLAQSTPTIELFKFLALGIPGIGLGGLLLVVWTMIDGGQTANTSRRQWNGLVPTVKSFLYGSKEVPTLEPTSELKSKKAKGE